jgi:hypothetical protein
LGKAFFGTIRMAIVLDTNIHWYWSTMFTISQFSIWCVEILESSMDSKYLVVKCLLEMDDQFIKTHTLIDYLCHWNCNHGQEFCWPSSDPRYKIKTIMKVRGDWQKIYGIRNHYNNITTQSRNMYMSGATASICYKVKTLSNSVWISLVIVWWCHNRVSKQENRLRVQQLLITWLTLFMYIGVEKPNTNKGWPWLTKAG